MEEMSMFSADNVIACIAYVLSMLTFINIDISIIEKIQRHIFYKLSLALFYSTMYVGILTSLLKG